MAPIDPSSLEDLEKRIGVAFQDRDLLIQALTHSSAKEPDRPCNERLEFLGDSILGQVVSEHLYHRFPHLEEGDLSTMKSVLVSAKTLAERTHALELEPLILVGRGLKEKKSLPGSVLCNTFEAIIAAIYINSGMDAARTFILDNLRHKVDEILLNQHEKNYKSLLQDHAQKTWGTIPVYTVTRETGPDHRKTFFVVVALDGKTYGPTEGANKKEAEQRAAHRALQTLGLESPDPSSAEVS